MNKVDLYGTHGIDTPASLSLELILEKYDDPEVTKWVHKCLRVFIGKLEAVSTLKKYAGEYSQLTLHIARESIRRKDNIPEVVRTHLLSVITAMYRRKLGPRGEFCVNNGNK